jgi:predicted nucleic acid-binding protein
VRAVVADTGPIHYSVLIGHIEVLPALFEKVVIPAAVLDELTRTEAPKAVREWIQTAPEWLEVHPIGLFDDSALEGLDDGERRRSH